MFYITPPDGSKGVMISDAAVNVEPNDNTKKIESIFFMLHVPYVV